MSTPTTGDLFLVNRGGTDYQLDYDLMSTLQDTDLLLVNRAGVNYQIAAADINLGTIESPVEVVTPVNGAGLTEGQPYTPVSSVIIAVSNTVGADTYTTSTVASVNGSDMVFTNDTNLDKFNVGDVIITAPSSSYTYTASGTTTRIYNNVDLTGDRLVWTKGLNTSVGSIAHVAPNAWVGLGNTESGTGGISEFKNDGYVLAGDNLAETNKVGNYVSWSFTNASGFFNTQDFTGIGGGTIVLTHNLGTGVGLMLLTNTNDGSTTAYISGYLGTLESTDALAGNNTNYVHTNDTNSIRLGSSLNLAGVPYKMHLWALNKPGVTKSSTFSASGTGIIDCGFEPGWVLLKNAPYAGTNWVVFDSTRGNDVGVPINGTQQEINYGAGSFTFTATGFTVNSTNRDIKGPDGSLTYFAIAKSAMEASLIQSIDLGSNTITSDSETLSVGETLSKVVPYDQRVEFADGTELSSIIGPVTMTDAGGAPVGSVSSLAVEALIGNTLYLTNTTGTWAVGKYAKGALVNATAPEASDITFTSSNGGTTAFSGTAGSLAARKWTLETSSSASGPWTQVGVYTDTAANASQNGSTPWSNPTLSPDTYYRVKVTYEAGNSNPVTSAYNTFKTRA